jgi:hypothetical protein
VQRPKSAQLDALFSTVEQMRQTEQALKDLKARAAVEAQALATIPDKKTRVEVAIYAYWFAPEVNASDIAMGATGRTHPGRLLKLAGPVSIGVPCDRCGEDLPIRSRNQMKDVLDRMGGGPCWPEGYRLLCIGCEDKLHEERRQESDGAYDAQQARQRELSALPYQTYLRTPDWLEIRNRHLWYRLETEGPDLDCEVCRSQENLGVFHRTLEGLGRSDDLVLLCGGCLRALEGGQRMAGDPDEGNWITAAEARDLAEAYRANSGFSD